MADAASFEAAAEDLWEAVGARRADGERASTRGGTVEAVLPDLAVAVEDLAGSSESGAFTTTELFNRDNPDHVLARTGNSSRRLAWMNKAER